MRSPCVLFFLRYICKNMNESLFTKYLIFLYSIVQNFILFEETPT